MLGAAGAALCVPVPSPLIPDDPDSMQSIRAEAAPIVNGAQLLVFFEELKSRELNSDGAPVSEKEIPLFAVLRDTLSADAPAAGRLRQVWIFTAASPSVAQRMAAAVPFLYHRAGLDSGSAKHPPKPILDLGQPARGAWKAIAVRALQAEVFDPFGVATRLTTRSYGMNLGEYRRTHVAEMVDLMNDHASDLSPALSPSEVIDLSSRLDLSLKLLGPYVSDEALPRVFERNIAEDSENRGHNWDLLRQAAERNGLYFEPLRLADAPESFAVIWIARRDAETPGDHAFNPGFLRIDNPFHDDRVVKWKGYSQVWTVDAYGSRVPDGAPGGNQVEMIPLAVYSLDYPGAPLLMVDFRDPGRPQRRELGLRLANDVTTGVLGLTGFGNFGYVAAKTSYMFVHKRHGGATNRLSRRGEFLELRHALGTDDSLDPELRRELIARVEKLNLDPVEKTWPGEIRAARRQYEALMRYAADPKGMAKLVNQDRWQEYRARRAGTGEKIAAEFFHRGGELTALQTAQLREWREADTARKNPPGADWESPAVEAAQPRSVETPAPLPSAGQ